MLHIAIATLAMLSGAGSAVWQDDGTVKIAVTFAAEDPRNPFPQGEKLLMAEARSACGDKGTPALVGETVVTGIAMAKSGPQISMSGTYACRKS